MTHTYLYDAFGNQLSTITNDTNPFRYCGEYYDTETGNYYLRARYYDPSVGRFTQSDSVRYVRRELSNGASVIDPLSLNLYTYCANSPVMYKDPTGHAWETILDIAGIVWSAVDFAKDPSLANLAFLAWDVGAAIIPFVPGSYMAKGGKLAVKALGKIDDVVDVSKGIRLATKIDDGADVVKFAKEGNILYGSFKDMSKYTSGYNHAVEAHHLLERRFSGALGFDVNDMISVVLTREQHQFFTKRWNRAVSKGIKYADVFDEWNDLRDIAKWVYEDYPYLFELLDGYMNTLN